MRYSVEFKNCQKRAKKLQCKKMNRNERNSQTKSVFGLVAEKIHKLRGISPYGYHGGTLGLRRGSKISKNLKKRLFKANNALDRIIITNEHFFNPKIT